jgi:hypothetical protein
MRQYGLAVLVADHHAGIETQEFESKQPGLHNGANDHAAALPRAVPGKFPRSEARLEYPTLGRPQGIGPSM